jgi:hypothetical protein
MKTFITNAETYSSIEQVPPRLRDSIKFAHSTGVPVDVLAIIYDMPVSWINMFVLDGHGGLN